MLLVDARGEDAAKKGTVEGAIAVIWQMFAAVSEGAAGDPMWGTVLEPAALSEALGAAGISRIRRSSSSPPPRTAGATTAASCGNWWPPVSPT